MAGRKPGAPKTGGRQKGTPNRATADIKELAQTFAQDAMEALIEIARGGESEAARVTAIKEIFDRAYGKAKSSHELTGPEGSALQMPTLVIAPFQSKDEPDPD